MTSLGKGWLFSIKETYTGEYIQRSVNSTGELEQEAYGEGTVEHGKGIQETFRRGGL